MEIPISLFLLLYTILLLVVIIIGVVNAYHVAQFGTFDIRNRVVLIAFAVYTLLIIAFTVGYLLPVDWTATVTLSSPLDTTPSFIQ